jgi:hypothetical protein
MKCELMQNRFKKLVLIKTKCNFSMKWWTNEFRWPNNNRGVVQQIIILMYKWKEALKLWIDV